MRLHGFAWAHLIRESFGLQAETRNFNCVRSSFVAVFRALSGSSAQEDSPERWAGRQVYGEGRLSSKVVQNAFQPPRVGMGWRCSERARKTMPWGWVANGGLLLKPWILHEIGLFCGFLALHWISGKFGRSSGTHSARELPKSPVSSIFS